MKKATFMVLLIASIAALAGTASATPFGVNDLRQGGGFGAAISQLARDGGGSNVGATISLSSQINTPQQYNGLFNGPSLPLPSSLILLGAGMTAWGLARIASRRRT